MGKKKRKSEHKTKHSPKKLIYFFGVVGVIILLAGLAVFLLYQKVPDSLYVYSENVKQGDTLFIKVKSEASGITGTFGNEPLIFYRAGKSEWISFKGIDANAQPGNYDVAVNVPTKEQFTRKINVSTGNFLFPTPRAVPLSKKVAQKQQKVAEQITVTDNRAINKVLGNLTPQPYFNAPFAMPLSKVKTSGYAFGQFVGFGQYQLQHLGVDLGAAVKTDVYAINDGKVVLTDNLPDYGNIIIIDHGLDIFSLYLHLDKINVALGDMVKRGQGIALSGETGYVFGPHLHFAIRVGTDKVDPIAFIQATQSMREEQGSFLASIGDAFNSLLKK